MPVLRTIRQNYMIQVLMVLSVLLFSSCASETITPPPANNNVPPNVDAGFTPPPSGEPNQLKFQLTVGDDGTLCGSVCVINVSGGVDTELVVLYQQPSLQPIPNAVVAFDTDVAPEVAKLTSKTGYTDALGEARVVLQPALTASGSIMLKASVPADPAAGEIFFHVFFSGVGVPPLEISANYGGVNPVPTVDVHLYEVQGLHPNCADVHPTNPENSYSAGATKINSPIQDDVTVDDLPGLAAVGTQKWTVVVMGPTGESPLVYGCKEMVAVEHGKTIKLEVPLEDLLLIFGNSDPTRETSYRVTTRVNMLTGLEGSAGSVVTIIVDLFTVPGEVVLPAACSLASGFLSQLCGLIVHSDGSLTIAGEAVALLINDALLDIIASALGPSVVFTGQSLAELLEKVWFGSTLSVLEEPQEQDPPEGFRVFGHSTFTESWDTVSYQWVFGQNCAPTDETCGIKSFKLADVYGVNFFTMPGAFVVDPDHLGIVEHEVPGFTYGILLNHMVENEVVTMLLGGPSAVPQGMLPYEVLIAKMFGGSDCQVDPSFGDCCDQFAVSAAQTVALPQFILDAACQLAIQLSAQWIRGQLMSGSQPLIIGTPDDAPCKVFDDNGDLQVDTLGTKTEPCVWKATFDVMNTSFQPDAIFYGTRN